MSHERNSDIYDNVNQCLKFWKRTQKLYKKRLLHGITQ